MKDFERIAQLIEFIDQNRVQQPSLDELAEAAGMSRFHLQRLFSNWAGVSPKAFLKCLTVQHAKNLLREGASTLTTALETGLSGPGRLHDLCVSLESASPGEIKSGGQGWNIEAGFAESPFGDCLIAEGPRGICHMSFVPTRSQPDAFEKLSREWPRAHFSWDDEWAAGRASKIFAKRLQPNATRLKAFVSGTAFQVRVWRSLLAIPPGSLTSYGTLAEAMGSPSSSRAVGNAVAQNQIAYLIPCHRVIRSTGVVGDYRWGTLRKRTILAWETADSHDVRKCQ